MRNNILIVVSIIAVLSGINPKIDRNAVRNQVLDIPAGAPVIEVQEEPSEDTDQLVSIEYSETEQLVGIEYVETEPIETTFILNDEPESIYIPETTAEKILSENYANEISDSNIDIMADVIMHEVGQMDRAYVKIEYSDGAVATYTEGSIIRKYHARVLMNQTNSGMFPSTLLGCVKAYWASYLNGNYYSHSNQNWLECREDAVAAVYDDSLMPSNVFGATQDPYFADKYPSYSRWAKVSWDTGWTSGVFYYYQYTG